jgi:hypothetical protein
MGTLHEDQYTFLSYLAQFFLEWEILQTEDTRFSFNNIFFFENPTLYEKMSKNTVEPDRSQMTMWGMRLQAGYPSLQKQTKIM